MTAISSILVISLLLGLVIPSLVSSTIYPGVTIQGVDIGGRSLEEATQLLAAWQEERRAKTIQIDFRGRTFILDATSIDLNIDSSAALYTAWHYGRDGSWWERVREISNAQKNTYNVPFGIRYNETKLEQFIEQWQSKIDRPACNATFSILSGEIISEQQGYQVDTEALRSLILQSFVEKGEGTVVLPVTVLYPTVTVADLTNIGIREIISEYTTVFNSQDVNRATNIKLAASKANGHIVYPGEIFSFNNVVGPREKSYGFKEAIEIVDGEFVTGVGGGICQLSSTLYNAALLANLEIIERYNHSKVLSYVPMGRDATVVFASLDFKFRNNTQEPLMVIAEVSGKELTVGIVGRHSISEKIEIITVNQEAIPPAIIIEQDDNLYLGENILKKTGKPGVSLTTKRVIRLHGQIIKQETLSKDRYLAEDALLKVGTRIPDFKVGEKKK